ncbi:DUF6551 family protein [Nocardia abscessus]|uniref:DUF6551 family protein n=1 Tax=Nocardia abscessus TaxID=120957 RepID=UPI0024557DEB|nr:DUF6551 family protein [Nocardia abscessus]
MTLKRKVRKRYEAIPVGKLHVDERLDAQRIFQPTWANKLAKIWDPTLLMVATVSERPDGLYYLIDGQHSSKVALQLEGPDFERDCIVYENLSMEMEARLFLAANRDRKPVKPYDNFRVAITAQDPLAVRVQEEVQKCGLEVSNGTSTNRVGAVQALMALGAKRNGLVARVLQTSEKAWGREATSWDNIMIRALGMVLHANWDQVDDKRLVKTLEKQTVARWKQYAVGMTPSGGGSASRSTPLANHIIANYNGRLGPEKMLSLAG